MSFSVLMTVEISGDRDPLERSSKALRNPRPLLKQLGVLGMSSAVRRLGHVLSPDAVRTGRLMASLNISDKGFAANSDAIFELSDREVVIGSNVPYAAQVHFGGRIRPKNAKALAIPLHDQIKRSGIGPSQADPDRTILDFVPIRGGASGNVFGLLVDTEGLFGKGEGEAIYALAEYVDQEPRPFLYWGEEDKQVMNDELFPQWLAGEMD